MGIELIKRKFLVHEFQVIHCAGYLKARTFQSANLYDVNQNYTQNLGLVAVGQSYPSSSIMAIKLNQNVFTFRANMDLKLILLDDQ